MFKYKEVVYGSFRDKKGEAEKNKYCTVFSFLVQVTPAFTLLIFVPKKYAIVKQTTTEI